MDATRHDAGTPVERAEPFEIHAAGSMLDDLRDRLSRTRWVGSLGSDGWRYGFDLDYLRALAQFGRTQGAYALVQGAQPHALAAGLNDSPVGLAAWIIEKFRRWSDCHGDVESRFTKDELLANVTLYWLTGTINSSFGPYTDIAPAGATQWIEQKLKTWRGSVSRSLEGPELPAHEIREFFRPFR